MKHALLIHDFCDKYGIPDDIRDNAHRMSNDELSLLISYLLQRIDKLENALGLDQFYEITGGLPPGFG